MNKYSSRNSRTSVTKRRCRRRREGYVLVIAVVMLFAIFAMATIVIDFGFIRLTQRQMLAATDAAAMEGLRWRDVQTWDAVPNAWKNNSSFQQTVGISNPADMVGTITSTAQQDAIRRWAATNIVSQMMATTASDSADPVNYGFGPELQTTPTNAGGGFAGPLVAPAATPVYQPQLQTNSGNATNGDVVSGYYGPVQTGVEQSDYTRNDFSPSPSSAAGATQPPSFLARMRRVAPGNSLDNQSGVSSSGPAVPYLFGYATATDRSIVTQGVTVRGTSIASVGFNPANNSEISTSDPFYSNYPTIGMTSSVGWLDSTFDQIGAVPIAIYSDPANGNDQWSPLVTANAAGTLTVAADGMTLQNSSGQTAGFLVNQAPWIVSGGQGSFLGPVIVGQSVSATAATLPTSQSSAYVLLVSAANQVIGFGAIDNLSTANGSITLTPKQNRVAWENASAMVVEPLASSVAATSLWTLRSAVQYPLYSPVLVNR